MIMGFDSITSYPFQHSPIKAVGGECQMCKFGKQNESDLCDLDLITLRLPRYDDFDCAYLWCKYGEDLRSIRFFLTYIKLWPLSSIIWPWSQNFKILLQQICLLVNKNIYVPLQLHSIKTIGVVNVWPWTLKPDQ